MIAVEQPPALITLLADISTAIRSFKYPPISRESVFQEQIVSALTQRGLVCDREVAVREGRYDISVHRDGFHVVLELKIKGSPAEAERHGVTIVTTSNRLGAKIVQGTLPGRGRDLGPDDPMIRKPFLIVVPRTAL